MRATPAALLLAVALPSLGCKVPEPTAELDLSGLETYWVIDSAVGMTQYIAPAIRFHVKNKGTRPWSGVQATATFRRKGEEGQTWGADWQVITASGKSLAPGQDVVIVLKSDGRYYSTGAPETMFQHNLFKDAKVEVFLRIGASPWTKFVDTDVERRIGSKTLQGAVP
ncbi:MAG: hypothetical protein ACHQNV_08185 [Vicinamibacteria bacterium]